MLLLCMADDYLYYSVCGMHYYLLYYLVLVLVLSLLLVLLLAIGRYIVASISMRLRGAGCSYSRVSGTCILYLVRSSLV